MTLQLSGSIVLDRRSGEFHSISASVATEGCKPVCALFLSETQFPHPLNGNVNNLFHTAYATYLPVGFENRKCLELVSYLPLDVSVPSSEKPVSKVWNVK